LIALFVTLHYLIIF